MKKVYNNLARMIENARYWHARNVFKKRYLKALSLNGILNQYVDGENEWLKKWRQLDPHITPLQYRLFSHYIGANINIVPEEISHFLIEPFLNSKSMAAYYSDKNMFDKILPSSYLPKTILRKINGTFYDPMYQYQEPTDDIVNKLFDLSGCERCIIKPSVGGESGKGVQLFQKSEMGWRNIKTNELLSAEYLIHSVGDNIIVQKAVCQHDYINHFNKTSVNTLRLAVYRSVKDNQCHVLGAIMRIGAIGSVVDNAHMGGVFVGIKSDGSFCKFACNQYGQTFTSFNGINFSDEYKYPNWNTVVEFGKEVSSYLIHNRIVALDIALDSEGKPVLIEYNITPGTYGMWLFQYTVGAAYGDFATEIINYCINK